MKFEKTLAKLTRPETSLSHSPERERRIGAAQHLECGAGDFRTHAVTRQNEYPQGHY